MKDLLRHFWALCLLVILFAMPAAVTAQPRLEEEIARTESILDRARQVVGPDREAQELLRNAVSHQAAARDLFGRGRPAVAARETFLARRLAQRAIEQSGGPGPGEGRAELERTLRRSDNRLAAARQWLANRSRPDKGLASQLADAERQMDRAWAAYRSGDNPQTLKHLATVRQILAGFPAFPEADGVAGHIGRQLDLTERLLAAMEQALPPGGVARLEAAHEAQRRARERLGRGQPGQAMRLGAEARAHAIRVWTESGTAPDRAVTRGLVEANGSAVDELADLLQRRPSPDARNSLEQAARLQSEAMRHLEAGNLPRAWAAALETSRRLWEARQSLLQDGRP